MAFDKQGWGFLDILDEFARGEKSPHVWGGAARLAAVIRRESEQPFGRQRLEQALSSTRREELAALLRYACYQTLVSESAGRCAIVDRERDGSLHRLDVRAWEDRLARAELDGNDKRLELVRAGEVSGWSAGPKATDLAIAALRIADQSSTRLYLAVAETLAGSHERAASVLKPLLGCGTAIAAEARIVEGFLRFSQGRPHQALLSYQRAAALGTHGPAPAFLWLATSCYLGVESEVISASWALSDEVNEAAEVDSMISRWVSEMPAPQGILQGSLEDRVRPEFWRVVNAICSYA